MKKILAIITFALIGLVVTKNEETKHHIVQHNTQKVTVVKMPTKTTKVVVKEIHKHDPKVDKIVKFMLSVNHKLSKDEAIMIAKTFIRVSKQENVPLQLLLAIAYQESHFKPYIINKYECVGLMQINRKVWVPDLPTSFLINPVHNIEIGAAILRHYYEKTGNWEEAIKSYYGRSKFADRVYYPSVRRKIMLVKAHL